MRTKTFDWNPIIKKKKKVSYNEPRLLSEFNVYDIMFLECVLPESMRFKCYSGYFVFEINGPLLFIKQCLCCVYWTTHSRNLSNENFTKIYQLCRQIDMTHCLINKNWGVYFNYEVSSMRMFEVIRLFFCFFKYLVCMHACISS